MNIINLKLIYFSEFVFNKGLLTTLDSSFVLFNLSCTL